MTNMSVVFILSFLLTLIHPTIEYEDTGRLHSQYRVYPGYSTSYHPTDPVTAIEWYYCGEGVKLCNHDLLGYYVGCYTDYDKPEKHYHACPQGTRCGCQIDDVCDLNKTCIPIEVPSPMVEKATFRFSGLTDYDYYQRDEREWKKSKITGVVKQDVKAKKYLQLISHQAHTTESFELIIPDDQGILTKVFINSY